MVVMILLSFHDVLHSSLYFRRRLGFLICEKLSLRIFAVFSYDFKHICTILKMFFVNLNVWFFLMWVTSKFHKSECYNIFFL